LSLRSYLDDCAFSHRLRQLLIAAGHVVQIPAEVDPPLTVQADARHFAHVRATGQIILTDNPADFEQLHTQYTDHPGILAVYQDNAPPRHELQRCSTGNCESSADWRAFGRRLLGT
jgi:hypothetical protein